MDGKQPASYFFIGSSSGKDVDGDLQVDRIEELLDPSASHKSAHIDRPPGLIGLEDPSQVPFEWEDVPVHKEKQSPCFVVPKSETHAEMDLTLRLSLPVVDQEEKLHQLGPSYGISVNVESNNPANTEENDGPSLVLMECEGCIIPVLVSEIDPVCPMCKSCGGLLDIFRGGF